MTTSIFLTAIAISIIYIIFRFIEMRFFLKENIPLKVLFRDTLLVYLSVLLGDFVLNQINPMSIINNQPEIFTNDPSF
jgi:hypothetical protein